MSLAPDETEQPGRATPGPGSPGARASRSVAVLLALACIVVATVGLKLSDSSTHTVDHQTVPGRPVEINSGVFTVTRVRAGSTIRIGGERVTTPGLFLVVTGELAAPGKEVSLDDPTLRGDGRTYADYTDDAILNPDAGFVSTSDFVFEVDPSRMLGLKMDIAQAEIFHGVQAHALVDLGITRANLRQWQAAKGQVLDVAQFPSSVALP